MANGINHEAFVKRVSEKTGYLQANIDVALRAAFDVVADELRKKGEINLKGIGRLTKTTRPSHPGRNPRTGVAVLVPAKTRVRFKASSSLVL